MEKIVLGAGIVGLAAWYWWFRRRWTPQTLKSLGETHGILVGTAVRESALKDDATFRSILTKEFNLITPENTMKFRYIHPGRNEYFFDYTDAVVGYARQHSMKIKGHCLLWYKELPNWLTQGNWSRDQLIAIMEEHIKTVVGRYKGKLMSWDVLNEAITGRGEYGQSIWHQIIGPEYIDMAFRFAHEADPNAILIYNDFFAEGLNKKSDAIYAMVLNLLEKGVPIHEVGFQTHLPENYSPTEQDYQDFATNLKRFTDAGVTVNISEMTVAIEDPVTTEKLVLQADIYGKTLETALKNKKFTTFQVWGFTDKHTTTHSRIYDSYYRPKPAYYALLNTLKKKGDSNYG